MVENLTTLFKNQIKSDIKDDIEVLFTYGAIGSGTATPAASDTTLGSEDLRDTIDAFDKSASSKIIASIRIELGENNGNTIAEVGWLNAASGGSLWTRNLLQTPLDKTSDFRFYGDTEITITVDEDTS